MTKGRKLTALCLLAAFMIVGLAFASPAEAGSCWFTGAWMYKTYPYSSCPSGRIQVLLKEECCYNSWYYTYQCSWKQVDSACL